MTDAPGSADNEGRPAPQYGQYATPEQVARARGMTLEEHQADLTMATTRAATPMAATAEAEADATSTEGRGTTASGPTRVGADPTGQASTPDVAHARNRFMTVMLLAFGLVSVFVTMSGFLNFDESLRIAFAQQGLEPYQSGELARTLGIVAVVGQVILWVSALAASVGALRRRRPAWWIPLVAGVVAVIFVAAIAIAAIVGDPSFAQFLQTAGDS